MRTPLGVVLMVVLAFVPVPAAAVTEISSDPFTNSDSQHATQVEPDTFSFGSTVVAAFQSGRFFDGGASGISFATSTNGGTSWTNGVLPGLTVLTTPPGPYDRATDPAVAFDAAHNVWLIATLGLTDTSSGPVGAAVLVSRSTDGGHTWSAPVAVSTATGGSDYDKTWAACDNWSSSSPHYGNCYASWDDFELGDKLLMSTSSDGGQTWGSKKSPGKKASGLGGIPLPQPDGTVIVPASNAFGTAIIAFRSTDGGDSWSQPRTVAKVREHIVAGNLRVSASLLSADVDASGKVYAVWSDCRFRKRCASNDLVMSTSTDGLKWTRVVRIPIDPTISTVDHFLPGLAVDHVDHATLGGKPALSLTYYYYPDANCTEATCQLFVGFVSSEDGGQTWSAPQTLADPISPSWLADTSQGRMVGDYISTSLVDGGQAVPVFALANAPVGDVFDEAMFADVVTPWVPYAAGPKTIQVGEPIQSIQSERPAPERPLKIR